MGTISYQLLDEQMSDDDKRFYIKLGGKVAALRKAQHVTQTQMADTLGVSQQVIAAYETGRRKIPASLLPTLTKLFAVSIEELLDLNTSTTKRGPTSKLQQQIEQISLLPRSKQKFVMEMLETVIKQQAS